jgi:hypothetical protein
MDRPTELLGYFLWEALPAKWILFIKNMVRGTMPRTNVAALSFIWLMLVLPTFCVMLMLFLS